MCKIRLLKYDFSFVLVFLLIFKTAKSMLKNCDDHKSNGFSNLHLCLLGELTSAEEMESGAVSLSTFVSYMKAAGGCCVVMPVFLFILLFVGAQAFTNYWLSYWISNGSGVSLRI